MWYLPNRLEVFTFLLMINQLDTPTVIKYRSGHGLWKMLTTKVCYYVAIHGSLWKSMEFKSNRKKVQEAFGQPALHQ